MLSPVIAKLTVSLIREEKQIMFLYNLLQMKKFFLRIEIPGRIIWITDNNALGLCSDLFLYLFNWRKGKIFFNIRGYSNDFDTGCYRKTVIISIEWFRRNNFVTGIYASHNSK